MVPLRSWVISCIKGIKGGERLLVSAALLEMIPAFGVVIAGSLCIIRTHCAAVLLEPSHRNPLPVAQGRPAPMPPANLSLARCREHQGCGSSNRERYAH